MLLWGLLLALPSLVVPAVLCLVCYRIAPHRPALRNALLTGVKVGGLLLYLGTCFFLNVPPPYLIDWLIKFDPLTLKILNYLGFPSTPQHQFYFGDMLVALGWLFLLGCAAGTIFIELARRRPFEPYDSTDLPADLP